MTGGKLKVEIHGNRLHIGEDFEAELHRTLRVPQDGKDWPLPASCGTFPVYRVDDYADRVPAHWREHGGVFIPMWQREAMWISFRAKGQPCAVKVAAGKVCAVTGFTWTEGLGSVPQDYMVTGLYNEGQPWLDGFKTGDGKVSQFVAMPLGEGYTAEAQVSGREDVGGLQIKVFRVRDDRRVAVRPLPSFRVVSAPVPNLLHNHLAGAPMPGSGVYSSGGSFSVAGSSAGSFMANNAVPQCFHDMERASTGAEMGLAPGGGIKQAIRKVGKWTPDAFDLESSGRVFVHIVNSAMFKAITGEDAPATPITAEMYTAQGYPWFSTYVEDLGKDVATQAPLAGLKTVNEIDRMKGKTSPPDGPLNPGPAIPIVTDKDVRDGKW